MESLTSSATHPTLSALTCSEYPSTPSRVQISIWPAGISSSAQGTIDWAGGMIDWQSDEIKQNGPSPSSSRHCVRRCLS